MKNLKRIYISRGEDKLQFQSYIYRLVVSFFNLILTKCCTCLVIFHLPILKIHYFHLLVIRVFRCEYSSLRCKTWQRNKRLLIFVTSTKIFLKAIPPHTIRLLGIIFYHLFEKKNSSITHFVIIADTVYTNIKYTNVEFYAILINRHLCVLFYKVNAIDNCVF